MSYEDLMRLAMFDGNDDTALVRFRHAVKHARDADAEIAALTERLRIVEAERDRWRDASFCADQREMTTRKCFPQGAELADLRAELERKDAALKIYQARAHRNANSTCDGCPFAVAERDVNWADRAEGYYTCGLDGKERWGEDPKCPDALYDEPMANGRKG